MYEDSLFIAVKTPLSFTNADLSDPTWEKTTLEYLEEEGFIRHPDDNSNIKGNFILVTKDGYYRYVSDCPIKDELNKQYEYIIDDPRYTDVSRAVLGRKEFIEQLRKLKQLNSNNFLVEKNNLILGRLTCPNCGILRSTDIYQLCTCGHNLMTGKVDTLTNIDIVNMISDDSTEINDTYETISKSTETE